MIKRPWRSGGHAQHQDRHDADGELALFRAVRVDPLLGTIVWPNDADIDPDVLRWGLRPASWG
jgi:hypothetical protein